MGAWKGIHHGILLSSSEELPMAQEKIESLPALDHGALNVIVETWKGQRSKFEFDFKRGNNCRDENGNYRWVHDATLFSSFSCESACRPSQGFCSGLSSTLYEKDFSSLERNSAAIQPDLRLY
jgi:hypothetical protein